MQDNRPNIRTYTVLPAIKEGRKRYVTRLLIDGMLCDVKYSTRKNIAECKGREWVDSGAHFVRLG